MPDVTGELVTRILDTAPEKLPQLIAKLTPEELRGVVCRLALCDRVAVEYLRPRYPAAALELLQKKHWKAWQDETVKLGPGLRECGVCQKVVLGEPLACAKRVIASGEIEEVVLSAAWNGLPIVRAYGVEFRGHTGCRVRIIQDGNTFVAWVMDANDDGTAVLSSVVCTGKGCARRPRKITPLRGALLILEEVEPTVLG